MLLTCLLLALPTPAAAQPSLAATSPSGETAPRSGLPGWRQVFLEEFETPVPEGSFPGNVYAPRWSVYHDGWLDTSRRGTYAPSRVLSVHDGVLDYHLRTESGRILVAAALPRLDPQKPYLSQTFGRYSVRFRADPVPGFKTAWLLWPDSDLWPDDGEIDFPEGDLDTEIAAYAHHASPAGTQDAFEGLGRFTSWHTATTEWSPGRVRFFLDGQLVGTSTRHVPTKPMHWVLQTETTLGPTPPAPDAVAHVYVDWVSAWAPLPRHLGPWRRPR